MRVITKVVDFLLLVVSIGVAIAAYDLNKSAIPVSNSRHYQIMIDGIDEMQDYQIKFKHIVLAQAIHETNSFSSNIYYDCRNLFGMKVASRRATTNTGKCRGHAEYDSYVASVKDYALWQMKYLPYYEARHGRVETDEDYYKFLRRQRYAEDDAYIRKLRKWVAKLKEVR